MWRNIIGQAIYQIIIFMLLLFLVPPGIIPYNFLTADEKTAPIDPVFWGLKNETNKETNVTTLVPIDTYYYQKA